MKIKVRHKHGANSTIFGEFIHISASSNQIQPNTARIHTYLKYFTKKKKHTTRPVVSLASPLVAVLHAEEAVERRVVAAVAVEEHYAVLVL